jgi:hypothetical protein
MKKTTLLTLLGLAAALVALAIFMPHTAGPGALAFGLFGMAALTKDRNSPAKFENRYIHGKVAATTKIYAGGITALSAGYLVPASDTAGLVVIGRAQALLDNTSGAAGDVEGDVCEGVFAYAASAALIAAARANVGKVVYVIDDQTVGLLSDTANGIVAGMLEEYDGTYYWVRMPGTDDQIAAGDVTAAMLADAVADGISGTPSLAKDAEGTGGANMITVTGQLKDAQGNALAAKQECTVWISDTAAAAVSGTPPSGAVAFTTGVQLKEETTKVLHKVITDANGVFVMTIIEAGVKSYYVNVAKGTHITSLQCTWA